MDLKITDDPKQIPDILQPIYLTQDYLEIQNYSSFQAYYTNDFVFPLAWIDGNAISIPKSPFGSIYGKVSNQQAFSSFLKNTLSAIKESGCNSLQIHHPSPIYEGFPSIELLRSEGLQELYTDIHQHIVLKEGWEVTIHENQTQKLDKLKKSGFAFRKIEESELKTAYDFISVCKQTQGIHLDLSWEELKNQASLLSGSFHCFGVFRDMKISAVCIVIEVTKKIAYYYLPATSPMFRSESPMVLLVQGLVKYYRNAGFDYLDLGSSSVQGQVLEPLRLFKERMGAIQSEQPTYYIKW